MKKCGYFKKFIFLMSLVVAFILPSTVLAASQGSIHVHFYHENEAISDAVFSAYRVADFTEDGEYVPTEAFSSYAISWKDLDLETASELGSTLSAYVSRDNIAADAQGKTDENGDVYLKDLPAGIYLVIGDAVTVVNSSVEDTIYFPQPAVVHVPDWDENGMHISDDVTIEPKSDFTKVDKSIERKALKIWKNDSSENRPSEITVQLLKNGEIYDEQTLTAEDNWRYTWSNLDPECRWEMIEKDVPDGYTATVSQQGVTFTLTNTYGDPSSQNTTPDKNLPNTGVLWWPVPVLLGLGAVLCIVGNKYKKNSKESYE